jgi:hypothetical protein
MAKYVSKKREETAASEALDLLQQTGVRVSLNELLLALTDAFQRIVGTQRAGDVKHPLSPEEMAVLHHGGFDLETDSFGLDDAVTRTAIEYATLLATSLSVPEAARLLQVDDSRIRQRLAARALYGLKIGHSWRLPSFQFEERRVIPGVEKVFPRLGTDLHPIAVYSWFISPDPDLVIEGSLVNETDGPPLLPMSPRDWLRSGGNADVVAEIAASL